MQRATEVRETGSWLTVNALVADGDPQDVQVLVLSDHAVVAGVRPARGEGYSYLLIKWPISVDPATAAAYLKGNSLTVTAKHSSSPSESTTHSPGVPATSAAKQTSAGQPVSSEATPEPRKKA